MGTEYVVGGLLTGKPLAARRAAPDVGIDRRAFGGRRLAIDVGRQEWLEVSALTHGDHTTSAFCLRSPAGCADNRSYNMRRPREILDITVPMGTLSTWAISA